MSICNSQPISYLITTQMKNHKILNKTEMATIIGGLFESDTDPCLVVAAPCTSNFQCCSNRCISDNSTVLGASCDAP
ncbi:bacteriocin [Pedobacter frigiditerrae]|uniref:Bacteriocin n=1 Tax=Pedobacter frigiditerrae TaxID=2530452 RepID=A0A4R0MWQ0_9SPHI|nr:bacteriocin [Pedobacter frigiditerrae]